MEDQSQTLRRAWAMRTSRNTDAHRRYVREQLDAGFLRQGWGHEPDQDLLRVRTIIDDPSRGWPALSEDQRLAWGHWRMLGEASAHPDDAMCDGDIVLVPNMPEEGLFTLCELTGAYTYDIDCSIEDLGHCRAVTVLTPGGVSNVHELVSGGLRRSLRCRSRLWWLGEHVASLVAIIAKFNSGGGADLRDGTDASRRARLKVAGDLKASIDGLTRTIEAPLRFVLQSAEWEPLLRDALVPLLKDVQVLHTGGPSEKGADLEIHIPNPFEPAVPWVIAVQVKDFVGQIGGTVADQLELAIQTRQDPGASAQGRLVAVVLASTKATPSEELQTAIQRLSRKYGVSVSCVHGEGLMRVIARGLLASYRDLPLG